MIGGDGVLCRGVAAFVTLSVFADSRAAVGADGEGRRGAGSKGEPGFESLPEGIHPDRVVSVEAVTGQGGKAETATIIAKSRTAAVTIPDGSPPTITLFYILDKTPNLTVPNLRLIATDNVKVTGYLVS